MRRSEFGVRNCRPAALRTPHSEFRILNHPLTRSPAHLLDNCPLPTAHCPPVSPPASSASPCRWASALTATPARSTGSNLASRRTNRRRFTSTKFARRPIPTASTRFPKRCWQELPHRPPIPPPPPPLKPFQF